MSYRDNVQALCDEMGISNPIQEEDLTITGVCFEIDGEWKDFPGTDMNRAGRLFFQRHFDNPGWLPHYSVSDLLLSLAADFFSENWLDAEQVGRPMLVAFKKATRLKLAHRLRQKSAENLREIAKKYLDEAACLELEEDLKHQTVRVAAGTVMLMLDAAWMNDRLSPEQNNEASKMFDWVGAYPDCRESELIDPATG